MSAGSGSESSGSSSSDSESDEGEAVAAPRSRATKKGRDGGRPSKGAAASGKGSSGKDKPSKSSSSASSSDGADEQSAKAKTEALLQANGIHSLPVPAFIVSAEDAMRLAESVCKAAQAFARHRGTESPAVPNFEELIGGTAGAAGPADSGAVAVGLMAEQQEEAVVAAGGDEGAKKAVDPWLDDGAKGGVIATKPKAGTSVRPTLPKPMKTLLDRMLTVHSLAETLGSGAKLDDGLFCFTWLESVGMRRVVETRHPMRRGEALEGEVVIPGASDLNITLHPRCSLPPGCRVIITDGKGEEKEYQGLGREDTSRMGGSDADAEMRWPQAPIKVAGPTVSYRLVGAPGAEGGDKEAASSGSGAASGAGRSDVDLDTWGLALTVSCPDLPVARMEQLLESHQAELPHAQRGLLSGWTPGMDASLCRLARQTVDRVNGRASSDEEGGGRRRRKKKGKKGDKDKEEATIMTLDPAELCLPTSGEALAYQHLGDVPLPQLRQRFSLLRLFSRMLRGVLPAFALNTTRPWTTGYRLRSLGHSVFLDVKQDVLKAALAATAPSSGPKVPDIKLSNFRDSAAQNAGDTSLESGIIFVQAFEIFRKISPVALRSVVDTAQQKVFNVRFEGESGIDAGGVYREGIQRVVESVCSEQLSLLLPSPNNVRHAALGSSSFVPNLAHKSPRAFEMLEFMGRFMGMSLRWESCLPFELPSLVWKRLLNEEPDTSDLHSFDAVAAETVWSVRHCDRETTMDNKSKAAVKSQEEFDRAFPSLYFVTESFSGDQVELIPDGKSTKVTFANRHRWCDLMEQLRLREFDEHIAHIRRGMGQVVPLRALALFTWNELEVLVCGSARIDLAYLKKNTTYSGWSETDPTVKSFWKVLQELSDDERSKYIRFAWGRSRLPSPGQTWTHKHTLTKQSHGGTLPVAHTCFFQVELPEYSTVEVARKSLLIAINFGLAGILQA